MQYRVTINIRRKGQGFMEGVEYKTEHFDALSDLIQTASMFIEDTIFEDMEGDDE